MEANLAVLIDFENIAAGTEKEGLGRFDVDAVLQRVKDKGRVLVARSYADWGRFARFKQSLLTANVTMYELTSHGMHDKNRADIAMVVDALELAFTRDYIDTFVVVSGDSDFTPLVLKMRELNKRVIGCGTRSSTSRLLIQACDEFIFYDSIVTSKQKVRHERARAATPDASPSSKQAAYVLAAEAVEGLLRESSDPPLASVVKGAMLRKSPDFAETDYGFNSFARFLEAAQKAGYLRVSRDAKSGGYRVEALESEGPPVEVAFDVPPPPEGPWIDPYAPAEAEWVFHALAEEGYNPLAAPTRMAVLQALEENVTEREEKRRRVNIQFVREDVRRQLKKTHPELPAKALRSVFDALMNIHTFMHKDGTPVRTANASFVIEKTAEEMNRSLTNLYLETLNSGGRDLSGVDTLAELFLGDRARRREIEETLAWLDAPEDDRPMPGTPVADLDEIDLDGLLEVDEAPAKPAAKGPIKSDSPAKAPAKAASEREKPNRSRRGRGGAAPSDELDLDAALLVDDAPAAPAEAPEAEEEAPARKPRRRRARSKAADPAADGAAGEDDAAE